MPNFTSFCDVNSTVSCTQAYLSAYGELGGVPVAIFGALYFAAVLALAGLAWRPAATGASYAPVYIFALSVPALAFVAYLAFAAFFILNAFCILCAITYVAVIGITVVSWRASTVPFGTVPAHASRDAAAAIRESAGAGRRRGAGRGDGRRRQGLSRTAGRRAAAVAVEALPVVADDDRAKLAEWWEVQPKVDVPVDGGGAKVVVVKFNDYQCPLCGVTYNVYKPVFEKYPGAVKLVTKHYPLEAECNPGVPGGGHLAACEAAAAVIMAHGKGTAPKMEDWLFSHQGPPILTPKQVRDAARDVARHHRLRRAVSRRAEGDPSRRGARRAPQGQLDADLLRQRPPALTQRVQRAVHECADRDRAEASLVSQPGSGRMDVKVPDSRRGCIHDAARVQSIQIRTWRRSPASTRSGTRRRARRHRTGV